MSGKSLIERLRTVAAKGNSAHVLLSEAADAIEAERERAFEAEEAAGGLIAGKQRAEYERDTYREALRPVAELADRLAAKGHLTPDPLWKNDPDLTFPCEVELSVTDLKRAQAAFTPPNQDGDQDCEVPRLPMEVPW